MIKISKFKTISNKPLLIHLVDSNSSFVISNDQKECRPKTYWSSGVISIKYSDGSVSKYIVQDDASWDCDKEMANLLPVGSISEQDPVTLHNLRRIFNSRGFLGDADYAVIFGPLNNTLSSLRDLLFSNIAYQDPRYTGYDPRVSHLRAYLRCCQLLDMYGLQSFRRAALGYYGGSDSNIKYLKLNNCRGIDRLDRASELLEPIVDLAYSSIAAVQDLNILIKSCDSVLSTYPNIGNLLKSICCLILAPRLNQ